MLLYEGGYIGTIGFAVAPSSSRAYMGVGDDGFDHTSTGYYQWV